MSKRLAGVLLVLLLGLAVPTAPAWAVEGGGQEGVGERHPVPDLEEVVQDNDIARQFVPEPYEAPTWFPMLQLPLLIVGILITMALLFAYLVWQPRFAQERKEKSRRR